MNRFLALKHAHFDFLVVVLIVATHYRTVSESMVLLKSRVSIEQFKCVLTFNF